MKGPPLVDNQGLKSGCTAFEVLADGTFVGYSHGPRSLGEGKLACGPSPPHALVIVNTLVLLGRTHFVFVHFRLVLYFFLYDMIIFVSISVPKEEEVPCLKNNVPAEHSNQGEYKEGEPHLLCSLFLITILDIIQMYNSKPSTFIWKTSSLCFYFK